MDYNIKNICIYFVVGFIISLSAIFPGSAEIDKASMEQAAINSIVLGNDIYDISVEIESGGSGIGTYTVCTGDDHPIPNENILYGGANHNPWSTFMTIRSYSTETDYITRNDASSSYNVYCLDPALVSTDTTDTSATLQWQTGPESNMPDNLDIVQYLEVEGTTFSDSKVRVTTNVTNDGAEPVFLGMRYEWDIMVDGVDGAWFAEQNPDGSWVGIETEWNAPAFESYIITNNPDNPILTIFGTVTGPETFNPQPTSPDLFQYVSWSSVYSNAFDYTPTGQSIGNNDSALTYYIGNDASNAIELASGETVSMTHYLYAIPEGQNVPIFTQNGLIILIGLLSVIAVISIRKRSK